MRRLTGSAFLFASFLFAQTEPAVIPISGAPVPIRILVQGPGETDTDLQVICLFRSSPVNTLRGSLIEANEKLRGLLDRIRKPTLFGGEFGETLLLAPPRGTLKARKLLILGLGDSQTFAAERMRLVGAILYREANRIGVAHPFFAPTIVDGGVTKYTTGQISEQVITGFLQALATEAVLKAGDASAGGTIVDLTYLAGPMYASTTRQGIEKAIAAAPRK